MHFIDELKRRNVFRVAALYVVGSWAVLQFGDLLFELMGLPAWALRIVFGILLLGFPVALVLSWIYELTPDGVRRDQEVAAEASSRRQTGRKLNVALIAAVVLGLGLVGVDRLVLGPLGGPAGAAGVDTSAGESPGPTAAPPAASIAVLPFTDLSPKGDQAYFSDGVAEEILNVLADVQGLAVASRTSSFQFRSRKGIGIPAIAHELNVRHVLEGSVRKAGNEIRITAQLIDAQTDQHLWSKTFDRTLTTKNLFAIQEDIASAIVASIRENLGVTVGEAPSVPVRTDNVDAYTLYLQGRSLYRSRVGMDQAEEVLARAVELDPDFADALAMRGAVFVIAPEYGYALAPSGEASRKRGRELAEEALALDPNNVLALGAIGLSRQIDISLGTGEWTYGQILEEFDRALTIEPKNPNLLNWRGLSYLSLAYFDRAEQDFRLCTQVEPAYGPCWNNRVAALIGLGRRDEANAAMLQGVRRGAGGLDTGILLTLVDLDRREAFYYAAAGLRQLRGWRANGELYDALRNPEGDHTVLRLRLERLLQDNHVENSTASALLIALGDFERTSTFSVFWLRPFRAFRASESFKRLIHRQGIYDYWREKGFPDICRPAGEDDFECQ